MRIYFEEHQYQATDDVLKDLRGIYTLGDVDKKLSVSYVGYYYNREVKDCIFILPKVLLEDKQVDGKVTLKDTIVGIEYRDDKGQVRPVMPEDIISRQGQEKYLSDEYRRFIYGFAVWIYRALSVYRKLNNKSKVISYCNLPQEGHGRRREAETFLDVVLSLIRFNEENQNFFTFTIKNLHSGLNKVNWKRTINRTTALVQDDDAVYLNPINKTKRVNFEEELFVIFFSILHYIEEQYGFRTSIKCGYELMKGAQFKAFSKRATVRLKQIKYKYFSDKMLRMWDLCFAFFNDQHKFSIDMRQEEYLLAKNFYIVFEAIIDELIGDNPLPDEMDKRQEDGKIVDHLFTAKSLLEGENNLTYYIGDSKYYKIGHLLTDESIYKQYTYARNVIQWNLDIFNRGELPESGVKLRDDLTEGYNIIPNFFISAKLDKAFDYSNDGIDRTDRKKNKHKKVQFKNRLFDRDTLLLFHYDINFLFALSMYARCNTSQISAWKRRIRDTFRDDIQHWLGQDYNFYAMTARKGVNAKQFFKEHFQDVLGKIYTPFSDDEIYTLALEKSKEFKVENDFLLLELKKYFVVAKFKLNIDNPRTKIEEAKEKGIVPIPKRNGILMVMMEDYDSKRGSFLCNGKLAIGLKYTMDSMEIVGHISMISYVLFHTRSANGQHLIAIKGECKVVSSEDIEEDRFKDTDATDMYVMVDLDTTAELDATCLDSTKKNWTNVTRGDAQFSTYEDLSIS